MMCLKQKKRVRNKSASIYLQQVPDTFFYVGGKNEAMDAIYPHHHPKFDVDESTITTIARVFYEALVVQGAFQ